MKDYNRYWDTLLWAITDGNVSSRKELIMMDIFSFYGHLEAQEDIIDKRLQDIEKRRKKATKKK